MEWFQKSITVRQWHRIRFFNLRPSVISLEQNVIFIFFFAILALRYGPSYLLDSSYSSFCGLAHHPDVQRLVLSHFVLNLLLSSYPHIHKILHTFCAVSFGMRGIQNLTVSCTGIQNSAFTGSLHSLGLWLGPFHTLHHCQCYSQATSFIVMPVNRCRSTTLGSLASVWTR